MRKLFSLLLVFSLNTYAAPPVAVNGELQNNNFVQNIKVPNYQATSLGGINTRLESGNTNLLINPSFEHTTITTGWTITNATGSGDTSNQVEGKKALSLSLSGALALTQDSSVNAANLVGLQGVASIKIKSSNVSGLKVCARNAGVTSSTLCVNVTADGTWKHVSIPFIMTATSNGIAITSTGTTGTVIVDDAFVGTSAPFQDVSGARLMGTVTFTACAGSWSTASTTFASFATQTGCTVSTTGSATNTTGTGLTTSPKIQFSSLPAGDYRLEYEGSIYQTTGAKSAFYQFSDGTNTAKESSSIYSAAGALTTTGISQNISYSTAQSNITLEIKAKTDSGGGAVVNGTTANPGVIKVYYFPPTTKIYSQASQDYDWTAYTPTFTGFGTVSVSDCYHKREGSDLLLRCRFTPGTNTATEARISLPSGLTTSSSILTATPIVGFGGTARVSPDYIQIMAQANTSYINLAPANTTISGLSLALGSSFASNTVISFNARVPIQGWSDYGVIVGSFAGIEKCANDYECTDSYSARVSSTGSVSNENIDWINGSCSVNGTTGDVTCNLVSGVFNEANNAGGNCNVTPIMASGVNGTMSTVSSSTNSQVIFKTNRHDATIILGDVIINCAKQGTDYKPKTAKVASSIGVPTVPGITTQAIDTFSFSYGTTNLTTVCSSSPCYLDQFGQTAGTTAQAGAVSSVTRSGVATYSLNLNKTYTKLKCSGVVLNAAGNAGVTISSRLACESCNSLSFSTGLAGTGGQDTYGTITCQGSY